MAIVHFGVVDVAYTEKGKSTTTGDVAEILEDKYSVMQTFIDLHEKDIGNELADQLMGLLESARMGAPVDMSKVMFPKVDAMFRDYLDRGEWEKQKGNMPTKVAQAGVSHRKKRPYVKENPARPSFIDTGLYQSSFRTWLTK